MRIKFKTNPFIVIGLIKKHKNTLMCLVYYQIF